VDGNKDMPPGTTEKSLSLLLSVICKPPVLDNPLPGNNRVFGFESVGLENIGLNDGSTVPP
jgi:hypothetical protein